MLVFDVQHVGYLASIILDLGGELLNVVGGYQRDCLPFFAGLTSLQTQAKIRST